MDPENPPSNQIEQFEWKNVYNNLLLYKQSLQLSFRSELMFQTQNINHKTHNKHVYSVDPRNRQDNSRVDGKMIFEVE